MSFDFGFGSGQEGPIRSNSCTMHGWKQSKPPEEGAVLARKEGREGGPILCRTVPYHIMHGKEVCSLRRERCTTKKEGAI